MNTIKNRLNISDSAILSNDVILKYTTVDKLISTDDVYIILDTLSIKYLNFDYYIELVKVLNNNGIVPMLITDTLDIPKHIVSEFNKLTYGIAFVDCYDIVNEVDIPKNIDFGISKIKYVLNINQNASIILCDYSTILSAQFVDGNYYYIAGNNLKCTHHLSTNIDYMYNRYNNTSYVLSKIFELGITNINTIFLDNYSTSNMFSKSILSTYSIEDNLKKSFVNNDSLIIIEADNISSSENVRFMLSLIGCNIVLITKSKDTVYIDKNDKITISYNIDEISELYKSILQDNDMNMLINIRTDMMSDICMKNKGQMYTIDREMDNYKSLYINDKVSLIKELMSIKLKNIHENHLNVDIEPLNKIFKEVK